ncbi:radical SAM protein [Ancylomarina euxinus]|uniref:Radical SAM protein n=1 Tax=Ancylomarina euxinus TaxID=2283627 RepID=A0A425XYX2_9BACT|nr:radical SAM protein [Ancylomarina euxinus]MCZ4695658.1 radical SAM protein [Ancylomarina euxinus]MUP16038.1 radical SAM protein [Ancylomarina euxinus]RRG20282.1 radical SAM protein [Ancylomarina euxinus]
MATFLFDKIIFGPVKSRRLGVSLGINLLPNDSKLCSFNCIYCECGWNPEETYKVNFHPRAVVKEKLEQKLNEMKNQGEAPDVITFAGNGEPCMHPEFAGIIDDTIEIRNLIFPEARIAVLSNATMIHKPDVFDALNKVEDNILKLDGGKEETIIALDQPVGTFNLEKTVDLLSKFNGNLTIQTLFIKGEYKGESIDNTSQEEIDLWLEHLKKIQPREVMIYTISRDTPVETLRRVELEDLERIAKMVEDAGFSTQISA